VLASFISCLATGHCFRLQMLVRKLAVMTGEFLRCYIPPFRGSTSNWATIFASAYSSTVCHSGCGGGLVLLSRESGPPSGNFVVEITKNHHTAKVTILKVEVLYFNNV
jgi:hypothetical protein